MASPTKGGALLGLSGSCFLNNIPTSAGGVREAKQVSPQNQCGSQNPPHYS